MFRLWIFVAVLGCVSFAQGAAAQNVMGEAPYDEACLKLALAAVSKEELSQNKQAVGWLIKCAAHPTWRMCLGADAFIKAERKVSPIICENKSLPQSEAKAALIAFENAIAQPPPIMTSQTAPSATAKTVKSAPDHPGKRKSASKR